MFRKSIVQHADYSRNNVIHLKISEKIELECSYYKNKYLRYLWQLNLISSWIGWKITWVVNKAHFTVYLGVSWMCDLKAFVLVSEPFLSGAIFLLSASFLSPVSTFYSTMILVPWTQPIRNCSVPHLLWHLYIRYFAPVIGKRTNTVS